MRAALLLTTALLTFHAFAGPADAASGRGQATSVELVQRADGRYVPRVGVRPFTLAGVQWRGDGQVEFRTRSADGTWSRWRDGSPEAGDAPDSLTPEAWRRSWHLGSPWWVGMSDRIEARARGRVSAIRAELVRSPEQRVPYRRLAEAETPSIVPRAGWGADETIRRGPPSYASDIKFVAVHHTAGTNDYSRAEAPAIVRGIELYHVRSNGWNDIGYNFLVDRFGTIYEGRYGGVDRNVVGAHALGFNTGAVGIAVLGSYGSTIPTRAAQDAVARLIAWRLDVAHVDPTSTVTVVSGGSERYPSGTPVQLRVVSGHRDTGSTECPGDQLYSRLDAIAAQARGLGGPKIFAPIAEATGSSVRLRARLSGVLPWVVSIASSTGVEVARGTGTGISVDWTWDSASVPAGKYTWTISTGTARPATGVLRAGGAATPSGIEDATVEPAAISPNADGQADMATVSYRLTGRASVTVQVKDGSGAVVVATLADNIPVTAGPHATTVAGDALPDGAYYVVVTARPPTGLPSQTTLPLTVSRTLGLVSVLPSAFSPNGDGRSDLLDIGFALVTPATTRIRIEREGRRVATPFVGDLAAGQQTFSWAGTRSAGPLRDGSYSAVVEAQDAVGTISFGVPFTVDTAAPRVRILKGRGIRVEVSEPAALVVRVDGTLVEREVKRAGVVRIPSPGGFTRVSVVATDAAGNRSRAVVSTRRKSGGAGQ